MTPAEKAAETRKKHEAARRQRWAEQREAVKTAKKALLRVMESEAATPTEILEAASLLAKLEKY